MASKQEKHESKGSSSVVGSIVRTTLGFLADSVMPVLEERVERILSRVESRFVAMQERMLKRMAAYVFLCLALVSGVVALLFYLVDTLALSKSLAFLVIALVLGAVAYVFLQQSQRSGTTV